MSVLGAERRLSKLDSIAGELKAQLDPSAGRAGLSPLNLTICGLILASVALAVVDTEPTVSHGREGLFRSAELFFATLFSLEYGLRLWCAGVDVASPWKARLKWLLSPAAIIDLAAILPGLMLLSATPAFGLRLLRIIRILRIARLGRFSTASRFLIEAIAGRRFELYLTFMAALTFMLLSATLMYLVEGAVQPERFGSIPRSMWWATVTLTTIGYGDVTPITPLGRVLAGVTAFTGIGLIAAPTGILAAAFSEAARRHHVEENSHS